MDGFLPAATVDRPLVDGFGRTITYLRISVTDRCDFRCVYCMSEAMTFLPKTSLLTLEELDRIASTFIRRGVRKLRLTGGEPLVRRGILTLIERVSRHLATGALDELTLTTNGSQLTRMADALAGFGVRRINVSLDSLDAERFKTISRWGRHAQVIDGLMAAKAAGLEVKLNTVALRGVNDHEFDRLLAWCGDHGFDLTLIEVMPMGELGGDTRVGQYLPLAEVRERLARRWTLTESGHRTGGPARYVDIAETGRRLGFITPLTHRFCESCNRVRLTCTGQLYLCLGQSDAADLRAPVRACADDGPLMAAIDQAIARKPLGHDFVIARGHGPAVDRHMNVTGG